MTAPLGPLYVASALEKVGFSVRFLDMNIEKITEREFTKAVEGADIVGLSVLSAHIHVAKALIAKVRDINPQARIICGGPHVNLTKKRIPGADVCFLGEGDLVAGKVCETLVRDGVKGLKDFSGLILRLGNEDLNTGKPHVVKLRDRLPPPARHLIKECSYGHLVGIRLFPRVKAVASSRGCPYRCAFCSRDGLAPYREREPEEVVEEIEEIVKEGCDLLVFSEDNFAVNHERVLVLLETLRRRNVRTRLLAQMRVDNVTTELLEAFKLAGGWAILLGIESGSQEVLNYFEKGSTVEQARSAVQLADHFGLFTYGFFMIGAPVEQRPEFEHTLRFIVEVPLDFIGVNILQFQYGSKLWRGELARGRLNHEETAMITGPRFGSESCSILSAKLRLCYRHFYLRPRLAIRLVRKCSRQRDLAPLWFLIRFVIRLVLPFKAFAFTRGLDEFGSWEE